MLARAATGAILGVDAHPVVIEAERVNGLPETTLIGMARGAVRESMVRVKAAIRSAGISLGRGKVVVNMLPAELPKEASALDLPLALALMVAHGQLPSSALVGRRFFGELSLGGRLESVRGAALVADLARRCGERQLILPQANAAEAAVIPDVATLGFNTLADVVSYLRGESVVQAAQPQSPSQPELGLCFSDVRGQTRAKRALEIAAAGGHNVLMVGPPGSGKTMLARRLPTILPALLPEERIEVTRIHSAAGVLKAEAGLASSRPFRAPHHTASEAALCGGGSTPRPGEVTLAHRGVLFLDELPEFSRRALESLREPLEAGTIHIARASMALTFPAGVQLIAAMNPCPCGRFRFPGSAKAPGAPCLCSLEQVLRYRSRVSGPLLDRIDLHVLVNALPYHQIATTSERGEASNVILERVLAARDAQRKRFGSARLNAAMEQTELEAETPTSKDVFAVIRQAVDTHGLSARALTRAVKVARTIADLRGANTASAQDLTEALEFRILDCQPQLFAA